MNSIKVLSKVTLNLKLCNDFLTSKYILNIKKNQKLSTGYIHSSVYLTQDNNHIISISEWNNVNNINNWLNSENKKIINNDFSQLIYKENNEILYNYNEDETFLL